MGHFPEEPYEDPPRGQPGEVVDGEKKDPYKYVDALGHDGWELVSALPEATDGQSERGGYNGIDRLLLIFKREG